MADALLSIVLERLASVVEQQIRDELTLVLGVEAEIQSLTDTLRSVRDVLEDAERRQVKEKSVQGWLERLKDMAYQMDDVVDEWSTAILQLQIKGAESASMSKKKQVPSRRDITLKIKGIKQQLDVIASQRSQFNFISSLSEEPQRFITTSQLDIPEVYGRDMDKNTILGHLLGETCQETKSGPYIISIVGTGGMGKTTLAQLAYNHPEVKAHFDERIWVCVSDPFDPIRIFREIVEILQGESPNLHSLEALQQKIQTCIAGKKFLIVLDDVWTENHQLWGQLKSTLNCGESVVKMVGTTYTHSLEELSQEQARALFHQIAFFEKIQNIIGKNGRMFCVVKYGSWMNSVIVRAELIKLWMAQSYLKSDGSKEMEMDGRTYFEYLAARSFFQDFEKDDDDNIIRCKMHDIVHDFAQFLTQNECFIVEVDNQKKGSMDLFFQKIRHATLVVRESTPNFAFTCNMKNLHTLLAKEAFDSRVLEALGNLTCLRALDLSSNDWIKELPKEAMGKLINLRHLENYNTRSLKGLPKGIGRLSSLQTLVVFIVSNPRNLNNLRGRLSIQGLDEVKDGEAKSELKNKVHLNVWN
ncbi:hypothetical protein AAG906_021383 [Vitis piasezkii]